MNGRTIRSLDNIWWPAKKEKKKSKEKKGGFKTVFSGEKREKQLLRLMLLLCDVGYGTCYICWLRIASEEGWGRCCLMRREMRQRKDSMECKHSVKQSRITFVCIPYFFSSLFYVLLRHRCSIIVFISCVFILWATAVVLLYLYSVSVQWDTAVVVLYLYCVFVLCCCINVACFS